MHEFEIEQGYVVGGNGSARQPPPHHLLRMISSTESHIICTWRVWETTRDKTSMRILTTMHSITMSYLLNPIWICSCPLWAFIFSYTVRLNTFFCRFNIFDKLNWELGRALPLSPSLPPFIALSSPLPRIFSLAMSIFLSLSLQLRPMKRRRREGEYFLLHGERT